MGGDAIGFHGGFNCVNGSSIRTADFAGLEQNQVEQSWDVSFAVEFAGYRHHRFDVFGIAAQVIADLVRLQKKFVKLQDIVDRGAPDGACCRQGRGLDRRLSHPLGDCALGGQNIIEVVHGGRLVGQHQNHSSGGWTGICYFFEQIWLGPNFWR